MKSIRTTLISGACIVAIALSANFAIYGQTGSASAVEYQLADYEHARKKTEQLDKKVVQLLEESEQQIEYFDELYNELYDKEMKLVYRHITYSSRLVSRGSNFIRNRAYEVSNQDNAINLDLRTRSAVTAYEIDEYILKGTALEGLGEAFVQAEIDYNVNAMFLLTLAIHESAWGRSDIARDKNNLFGFGAYDASPYKSAVAFNSKAEGVFRVAKHLSENYLTEGAKCFSGGYTLRHVNMKYASDETWASQLASSMNKFNRKIMKMQDLNYHNEEAFIGERSELSITHH